MGLVDSISIASNVKDDPVIDAEQKAARHKLWHGGKSFNQPIHRTGQQAYCLAPKAESMYEQILGILLQESIFFDGNL